MRMANRLFAAAAVALGVAGLVPAAQAQEGHEVHLKDLSWPTEGLFGSFDYL